MRIPFSLGSKLRVSGAGEKGKKYAGAQWGTSGFSKAQGRAGGWGEAGFPTLQTGLGPLPLVLIVEELLKDGHEQRSAQLGSLGL